MRFLVFGRYGRHEWVWVDAMESIKDAISSADLHVVADPPIDKYDRVVVMEVSGVDAVPMFTFRYGTKG